MKSLFLIFLLVGACSLAISSESKHNVIPPEGYVANTETAIMIAIAVWRPIYGKDKIQKQRPYKASLKENVWYVTGSLPKGMAGGVAVAEISKMTGAILRISHGK